MPSIPEFSILIPAFNAEPYIETSIQSALSQTVSNIEVIVVDNHSTDGTWEIIKGFRDIRLRRFRNQKTVPMADNWQKAIDYASSDYATILSADDLLLATHVECSLENLKSASNVLFAHGPNHLCDQSGNIFKFAQRGPREYFSSSDYMFELIESNKVSLVSAAFSIGTLRSAGIRCDSSLSALVDWALWLDICSLSGTIVYTGEPTAIYRHHGNNVTARSKKDFTWQYESSIVPLRKAIHQSRRPHLERFRKLKRLKADSSIPFIRSALLKMHLSRAFRVSYLTIRAVGFAYFTYRLIGIHKYFGR